MSASRPFGAVSIVTDETLSRTGSLSGAPDSDPALETVSSVKMETAPGGREGDACVVVFSYHWPQPEKAGGPGRIVAPLTASVYLRRSGAAWAVDDARSRTLIPSWPQLPRTQRPF